MIHITVFWFGPTVFKVWLALISYQLSAVAIRVNVLPCLHDAEAAASHMSFKSPAGAQTPSCAVGKKMIFSLSLTESSPFCLIWEKLDVLTYRPVFFHRSPSSNTWTISCVWCKSSPAGCSHTYTFVHFPKTHTLARMHKLPHWYSHFRMLIMWMKCTVPLSLCYC